MVFRDEYPPFAFQYPPDVQYIRFLPEYENKAVGNSFKGICNQDVDTSTRLEAGPIYNRVCTEVKHITKTLNAMTMQFVNMPVGAVDDGLFENSCYPSTLTDDVGYALFTHDAWYATRANAQWFRGRSSYAEPPPDDLTRGKTKPRSIPAKKRWLHEPLEGNIDDIIVDEGNITRRATDQELWEVHNVIRCQSDQCESELKILGIDEKDLPKKLQDRHSPAEANVDAVTQSTEASTTVGVSGGSANRIKHTMPVITASRKMK